MKKTSVGLAFLASMGIPCLGLQERVPGADPPPRFRFKTSADIHVLAFSPDGRFLAATDETSAIVLFSAEDGTCLKTLRRATEGLEGWALAMMPDGKRLIGPGNRSALSIWNFETGKEELSLPFDTHPSATAASRNGRRVAGCGWGGGSVYVWDSTHGRLAAECRGAKNRVYSIAFLENGDIAASSRDGHLRIWKAETGELQRSLSVPEASPFGMSVTLNSRFLAAGYSDGKIRVWDLNEGRVHRTFGPAGGRTAHVLCVAFDPEGKRLFSGTYRGVFAVWDVDSGEPLYVHQNREIPVWSIAVSPDGKTVAHSAGFAWALRDLVRR